MQKPLQHSMMSADRPTDCTKPWKFGGREAPVLLVGDAGSGKDDILVEIADQAMALDKAVLFFTARGNMNCIASLYSAACSASRADRFYVNQYMDQSAAIPFHSLRARPSWIEAVNEKAVVCTLFPALERAADSLRSEADEILSDALNAVEYAASEPRTVILIDAIDHFSDGVRRSLARCAASGAEVILATVYPYATDRGLDLVGMRSESYLLRASSLSDSAPPPFSLADISTTALKNLGYGEGYALDRSANKTHPVVFSVTQRDRPLEIKCANVSI